MDLFIIGVLVGSLLTFIMCGYLEDKVTKK